MPRGGRRVGAGRKPKSAEERAVTGNPGKRRQPANVLVHPSSPEKPDPPVLPVVDESDAPDDLTLEERVVWMQLAPLAMVNGTLTAATSKAFVRLCKTMVVCQKMDLAPLQYGSALHGTWEKLLDARLTAFNLRPMGKPMQDAASAPSKPASPVDRFLKRGRGA